MKCFVLLLVLCVISLGYSSEISTTDAKSTIQNQKVFILTLPRSGSTFVGELFRQNPDFVYLFEPLRAFSEQFTWDNCRATPINEDLGKIMQSLYNCDFSVLNNSLPDWGPLYSWSRIAEFSGRDDACFPPKSNEPRSRQLSIAVKEIENWAPKLDWLNSVLDSEMYVIWLIRDVRGWVSSWTVSDSENNNFFNEWSINDYNLWGFYSGCDDGLSLLNTTDPTLLPKIKAILTNSTAAPHLKMAAWWTLDMAVSSHYIEKFQGRVQMVKYEDMAAKPLENAKKIYTNLNRPYLPKEVADYIQKSTRGGDVAERYNTVRNSAAMTDIWRSRLTVEQITEIEEIAGIWFSRFGYEKAIKLWYVNERKRGEE